ncbi:MAG: hypothetical protein ACYDEF_14515 [Methanosarcina sp.]
MSFWNRREDELSFLSFRSIKESRLLEHPVYLLKLVAHSGGNPPKGDLRKHFRELLTNCDSAMLKLTELVKTGCFEQKSD